MVRDVVVFSNEAQPVYNPSLNPNNSQYDKMLENLDSLLLGSTQCSIVLCHIDN